MSFWYANFQKSPYRGPTPFPHSVASLPRFGPLLKNPGYASDHIVYVCSLHFPLICIFFLLFYSNFSKKIHPKYAPDRLISISKMQKLPSCGREGTPPPTTSPPPPPSPARAPRAFFLRFPSNNVDNLAPPPPRKKFLRTALIVLCNS